MADRQARKPQAAEQPYVSPTQAVREMRGGVPITALREILHRLDVAQSVLGICAAVLQAQMADYDTDIAAALKHSVGDVLDAQMERITSLIEGGCGMNAPRKRAPSRSQGTGEASGKTKAAQPNQKKPTVAELPELDPILDAFTDAYAVVRAATYVLDKVGVDSVDDGDGGFALSALRQGVAALGVAVDRLDEAEVQLHRFRERAGDAS